ncbi:MAG TPA: type II toxin-antitoxin system ParD family antitoxin [Planctomycetaceae bacterium]|nr:type II toxin-antitoxin system ParD family antitoxin [Planctomycetaceae bacterium]
MVIKLPPDLAEFVTLQVAAGRYQSEDEVICDAVRTLQERRKSLQELIAEGMANPEDDIILETDEDLGRFLDEIDAEVDRERRLGR